MPQISITCSHCGESGKAESYPLINVRSNPELKEAVKNGSLFLYECPHCGTRNLLKFSTIYHDPKEKVMILLSPEGESEELRKVAEQIALSPEMSLYTLRLVRDAGSLIEKVNIFDSGLDDEVIELCKYVTKMEMAGKMTSGVKALMDAPFKFFKMQGPDNDLSFTFPRDGQMQGLNIGFNVYEDCIGILKRNPAIHPDAGFATVDADWISKFFR